MFQFVLQHQFWAAVGIYWIFSAAVSAMPEPGGGDKPGYLWLYRFMHTTAGNITTALGNKLPGLKILVPLLLVTLVIPTTACAAHYSVHPGAINTVDSAAYDTLLVAKSAIDQGRTEYQSGRLPSEARNAFNTLVETYNLARASWLTYRGAVTTNVPSDQYLQQLNKSLTDLTHALQTLQQKELKP
jgi:hypothetical protein